MDEVESNISSSVNGLSFPDGVSTPIVGRINPDSFPVLQLSVTGEREIVELQEILDSRILPEISVSKACSGSRSLATYSGKLR